MNLAIVMIGRHARASWLPMPYTTQLSVDALVGWRTCSWQPRIRSISAMPELLGQRLMSGVGVGNTDTPMEDVSTTISEPGLFARRAASRNRVGSLTFATQPSPTGVAVRLNPNVNGQLSDLAPALLAGGENLRCRDDRIRLSR